MEVVGAEAEAGVVAAGEAVEEGAEVVAAAADAAPAGEDER